MKLTLKDSLGNDFLNIKIYWHHEIWGNVDASLKRGMTQCMMVTEPYSNGIVDPKVEPLIYTGAAFCSSKDQFSKEKGRRQSLKVMLRNSEVDKAARKIIWEAYLNRKDKKVVS